jgi:hypothetical protein
MADRIQYLIDKNGQKTSVLFPYKTWMKFNKDYSKLQYKIEILTGIKAALLEVKNANKTGKKLQSLKSIL